MNGKTLLCSVAALAALPGVHIATQSVLQAATESSITLDAALDCRKFNYNRGVPLDQIVRGDGFIGSGKIFRAGTLRPGAQTNDPNDPGSIGTLVGRGTTTGSLAEHLADPLSPGVFLTHYVLLNDGMIVGEGWIAPAGANEAAVVGGTRAFRGATGEMSQTIIGSNITGCPNVRLTIVLEKQAPK